LFGSQDDALQDDEARALKTNFIRSFQEIPAVDVSHEFAPFH